GWPVIAAWMVAATLLAALFAIAALAGERALRLLGRQGRGPWLIALAGAVGWPVIAPAAAALLARVTGGGARAVAPGASSVVRTITGNMPAMPPAWFAYVDAALVVGWAL